MDFDGGKARPVPAGRGWVLLIREFISEDGRDVSFSSYRVILIGQEGEVKATNRCCEAGLDGWLA